jgi:hypothetical protein
VSGRADNGYCFVSLVSLFLCFIFPGLPTTYSGEVGLNAGLLCLLIVSVDGGDDGSLFGSQVTCLTGERDPWQTWDPICKRRVCVCVHARTYIWSSDAYPLSIS